MTSESEVIKTTKQDKRKRQILGATLRLIRRHGCDITTAQIAGEAHCSKETLYNWFGDRDGIMMALVREQAAGMKLALDDGFSKQSGSVESQLKAGCTLLLDIMTGEAVLAVNRVAMSRTCQDGSILGTAVLADWKSSVFSPFEQLFQMGNGTGLLAVHDAPEAFENLIGLLVGDRQRRLLLGEDVRPDAGAMAAIADKAVRRWLILYKL